MIIDKILNAVDTLNKWAGKIFGYLFIPLTFVVVAEVIMRYIFNMPIIGVWDIAGIIQGLIIIYGGSYTMLYKGHIAVDILTNKLSSKNRILLQSITDLFTIISVFLLLWKVLEHAKFSLRIKECYTSTWGPPIYHFKIAMAIGIFLMLLQAINSWIRTLKQIKN